MVDNTNCVSMLQPLCRTNVMLTTFQINYMLGTIWGLSTTFAILPLLGVNGYVTEVSSLFKGMWL